MLTLYIPSVMKHIYTNMYFLFNPSMMNLNFFFNFYSWEELRVLWIVKIDEVFYYTPTPLEIFHWWKSKSHFLIFPLFILYTLYFCFFNEGKVCKTDIMCPWGDDKVTVYILFMQIFCKKITFENIINDDMLLALFI